MFYSLLTLDEITLCESVKQDECELFINCIKKSNYNCLQTEDLRILFMFRLIFEKSHILLNSSNNESSDVFLQRIQTLQGELRDLNEENIKMINFKNDDFDKKNKYFYELLKNIVDSKPKLKHILVRDSENYDLDKIYIYDKEYKSSYNRFILSLFDRFEKSESFLANKSKILNDKREVFQEIKSVLKFIIS